MTFENKFENVVNNVLGKTIICDNIDNGLILAKKLNYKNRIITLAGDVINSGGALTGGSISQKNLGIMSRKAEIEFLNDKIIKINVKRDELLSAIKKLEEKQNILQNLKKENTEKMYNNKIDIINLKNKINNLSKDINKIRNTLETSEVKIFDLTEKIEKNKEQILNKNRELDGIGSKTVNNNNKLKNSVRKINENDILIKKQKEELVLLEEDAKVYENNRKKIKLEIENVEDKLELMAVDIAKKDEEIHRNEIIYTKQNNERKFLLSRLEEEFNTNEESEMKNFTKIENLQEYKKQIDILKNKMNNLGQVNVNSIEEFKELSQKYNFIKIEKEDLEKAKEELLGVIDEMLSKMKVVFRQNFNILNKNFQETFRELFKGGNAKLILDKNDELNGNIEINVQPPGKKVQNINLMSGGEKVLSAIAMLFAILKMKPTPFCILDEIEAALDDANVNRYAQFLKKFSKEVQFIVITHRKGTMESSDVMYGVTMEEKGVSKIVSVDLVK